MGKQTPWGFSHCVVEQTQKKSCSGRTFPVAPIILSCWHCKSDLQQAVTKKLPWNDSLTALLATGNPPLVPCLAAVRTCIEGKVCPLSPVFLPKDRVPEPEFIAEESNVTPHSTCVNFAVQRERIDAPYSATKLSKCLSEGQGEILWPRSSRQSCFPQELLWEAETTSRSYTKKICR